MFQYHTLRWNYKIRRLTPTSVLRSQITSTQLTWPASGSHSGLKKVHFTGTKVCPITHNVVCQLWHILRYLNLCSIYVLKPRFSQKKNIENHGELKRVTFWVQSFRVLPINFAIDLVTVFDAILTSRQTRLRNYSICMRIWLSNNFRRMAVLKKKMNCKLKLHFEGFYWKILRVLHALEDLEPLF